MPKLKRPDGRVVSVSRTGVSALLARGYTDPSAAGQPAEEAPEVSMKDLRADAKAWEIPANGSKVELAARLEEHRELVALELAEHSDAELRELAAAHDVAIAEGVAGEDLVACLVAAHLAWHESGGA